MNVMFQPAFHIQLHHNGGMPKVMVMMRLRRKSKNKIFTELHSLVICNGSVKNLPRWLQLCDQMVKPPFCDNVVDELSNPYLSNY